MEVSEMLGLNMVEEDKAEEGNTSEERTFKVGELVEFWEDSFARGYRTEGGEPAWVRADYGGGEYGIKMVINTRGKLRRVHWQRLYTDGSFNKLKLSEKTGRVKSLERMREIEQDKAEAKFAAQIRQTKLDKEHVEHEMKMKEREADDRLKRQEMDARQGQKDLCAGHKRNLEELDRRRDKDMKERDESLRQVRLKTREMVRDLEQTNTDLCEAIADKDELAKAVTRGIVRVDGLREHGMGWQRKHDELKDKMKEREERLTYLEGSLVVQTRELATLQRKQNDLAKIVGERNEVIELHAGVIGKV
jgi:chromosome segregation ATPase